MYCSVKFLSPKVIGGLPFPGWPAGAAGDDEDFDDELFGGVRAGTEEHALIRARIARDRFGADWGIGETGATGPTGNRYGDPAGHACIAVAGRVERVKTLRTGTTDRVANMHTFAAAALALLEESLA
jgi:nicotinamide mononucleotide (NMN) deamidase PncC